MIYFYKHSSELIYAWRKINSNLKYLALLHLKCHFCRNVLVDKFSTVKRGDFERRGDFEHSEMVKLFSHFYAYL